MSLICNVKVFRERVFFLVDYGFWIRMVSNTQKQITRDRFPSIQTGLIFYYPSLIEVSDPV